MNTFCKDFFCKDQSAEIYKCNIGECLQTKCDILKTVPERDFCYFSVEESKFVLFEYDATKVE